MCELTARHGRGTAWARHGHGMLCVDRPLRYLSVTKIIWVGNRTNCIKILELLLLVVFTVVMYSFYISEVILLACCLSECLVDTGGSWPLWCAVTMLTSLKHLKRAKGGKWKRQESLKSVVSSSARFPAATAIYP